MSKQQRFRATVAVDRRGRAQVLIPFDPAQTWGVKTRHPVTGSVAGHKMRGRGPSSPPTDTQLDQLN
ncbi:hypothetical protein [Jiangella asiatica]|uniref:Uncharacterized protein n=1 Tax=Jiangella asiatica TaxID=2530372 RepID=A0A4R5CPE5_9ACTN|nr:hypothetical protein [Jiangella asiatica]TDE01180.1 hypothetical protein E1269_23745 [Jiangella asiatica]